MAARLALFRAFIEARIVGMAEPMLMPQIKNEAKYSGISPCMARAWRMPTAAEEL